jgi:hypothetical protein
MAGRKIPGFPRGAGIRPEVKRRTVPQCGLLPATQPSSGVGLAARVGRDTCHGGALGERALPESSESRVRAASVTLAARP